MLNASKKALGNTYNLMFMFSLLTSLFTAAEDGNTCDFSFELNTEQQPVSLLTLVNQLMVEHKICYS